VGLRRHRAHQQAPGTRGAPHRLLQREIEEFYSQFRVTRDLLELRNLVQVADLIVKSALLRHESRGLHFTLDYPDTDDRSHRRDTILRAGDFG
jgi:L-aspartate oxidase